MKKILLILRITIGLVSFHNYTEVKNEELKNAFRMNSSPTFKGYFYQGSDNAFHYFSSQWVVGKDKYFKIPVNQLKVLEKLKFGKHKGELRIDVFKDSNDEFAENAYGKLYVEIED